MTGLDGSEERAGQGAADWFVRLRSDDATGEDWLAFERWLAAAPDHEAAFRAVEAAWVDLDPAATEAPSSAEVVALPVRRAARQARWAWPAAAAAALALLAVGAGLLVRPPGLPGPRTYQASAAGRDVALPGGLVHLGAGSRMALRVSAGRVDAALLAGRARFEVRHDPNRLLALRAGEATIIDVGTVFDVERDADGAVRLEVREGQVAVTRPAGSGNRLAVPAGEGMASLPGEAGPRLTAAGGAPLRRVYRDAPVAMVVADLNRVYTRPVRLEPGAEAIRFSGVLQLDTQDLLIRRLAAFTGLSVTASSDQVSLGRAARSAS